MAGDWIKVENVTPEKPEVYQMAEILGIAPEHVVGCLVVLWVWADQQTVDGNAHSVTRLLVDRKTGVAGFADAMVDAGWLTLTDDGLLFPNFERHNGKSAKNRSLTAKRVAKHKQEKGNARTVTNALPREEKRREEGKNPPSPPSAAPRGRQRGERLPEDWDLPNAWREWAQANTRGIDPDREAAKFRDFWVAKAGAGAAKKDWLATWRNWCRTAEERVGSKGTQDREKWDVAI